ncbi:MAG: N-6 DNA methylase [Prevotellaceae bacterium]|nr:N-6 DNA methylase [Prevotellaceae bacterium]
MNRKIFTYLKSKGLTDIRMVNRLFVSAFMRHYNLVPRRNVLLVEHYIGDVDDNAADLTEFIAQLDKCECDYALEELTKLFEFVISPSDRKITGAIYTPDYIRERIVAEVTDDMLPDEIATKRFADIACGCGGFFLTIAQLIHNQCRTSFADIYRENIFGIDIQDYSIERTKLLLSLLALMNNEDDNFDFHLYQANTLSFDFGKIAPMDIIVGNPPYVCARNMSAETRELINNWRVCQSGNTDLYIPFFQIAIELLRDGGRLGYITMNSFLTSLNGRALREYLHEFTYQIRIVDFRGEQMFHGRNTYTCLFFLEKNRAVDVKYSINESKTLPNQFVYTNHPYLSLIPKEGWKLNEAQQSRKHELVGTSLGKYCQSRHGIATLSNKTYVFTPIRETGSTFVFTRGNSEIEIERGLCRKIVNSNKLNSEIAFDDIVEYVIFPYRQNEKGQMTLIPEDDMRENFPLAYRYLSLCRETLAKRDKGHTDKYPAWYAYGRTQSLQMPRYKLFFPKIANKGLHCELVDDAKLLLYNGMAFVSDEESTLRILKKVMESELFWQYVTRNSKPYASGYYSLNGVNIKNFGIPNFTSEQQSYLLAMTDKNAINNWLKQFYE